MKKKLASIILVCVLIICSGLFSFIQAQNVLYTIKSGDNLIKISDKFNCSVEQLIRLNNIENPDKIIKGNKLKIPLNQIIYDIQKGDTLTKIARRFKVNLDRLISLNNINNPDRIMVGSSIKIPKLTEKTDEHTKKYTIASRRNILQFIWPLQGKISSDYGWRTHPIHLKRQFHCGIDIAVPKGSPVYASEEGVVIFSGWSKGYGRLVILQHRDNKKTYYAHNLRLLVKKGARIKQGKIIALSGNSGVSTGPHLHFEVRNNNQTIDPLKYLNQQYLRNNFKL